MANAKHVFMVVQVLVSISTSRQEGGLVQKMKCPAPPIRTCLDYLKKGFKDCGLYRVYDEEGRGFTVYCDMSSEARSAWTLIESVDASNRAKTPFRQTPFKVNAPVNENEFNWAKYRLSLERMNSLKTNSTHWRSTCSYDAYGVDHEDYVRGKLSEFDIMTFIGSGICKKVEFINLRGHQCSSCTAKWWQVIGNYHLHIDSSSAGCQLDARKGVVSSEDNFGYYATVSSKFRCTENSGSSTQWWFGGYLN